MAISLKHTFQSAKADGADTTLVQPSNWNAEHTITAAAGKVLGRDTSGAGAVQELPIAVDTSGNVGIGTSSPGAKLDVNDGFIISTRYGNPSALQQRTAAGTVSAPTAVGTNTLIGAWQASGYDGSAYRTAAQIFAYTEGAVSGTSSPGRLEFYTTASGSVTPAERMRIDSAGNVGIGTPSPAAKLHIIGGGIIQQSAAGYGYSGIEGGSATASSYLATYDASNVRKGYMGYYFSSPSATYAVANTDGAIPLTFGTNGSERMRIDSAGNVLIGTTTTYTNPTGYAAANFHVSGGVNIAGGSKLVSDKLVFNTAQYYIVNNGGTGVYLTNGAQAWSATSDERVKDIIEPITDAVSKVSSLRAVIGKFKTDVEGTRRSFLIAQDVLAVLPEAVDAIDDELGTLAVRYSDVTPLLVAAIKEQQAIIEDLRARLAAVEAK